MAITFIKDHELSALGLTLDEQYNFLNLHLRLLPNVSTATIPANTPIFSLYPTLAQSGFQLVDARSST